MEEEEEAVEFEGEEVVEEQAPQERAAGGEEPSAKKATREVADELQEVADDRPQKRSRAVVDELQELNDRATQGVAESVPPKTRGCRACLVCSLVKTGEQFEERGCDNCGFLHLAGDRERVNGVTTTRFSGFVGLMDPQRSWVARYQRLPHTYAQAVYAVQTKGVLPDDVQEILEDRGYAGMRPEGSSQE